ncbi:MAG: hypothetical protein KIT00_07835 [Rhodospirillales bacterium]|nr:hypothetical protein [Rhodospirillales bacterium]
MCWFMGDPRLVRLDATFPEASEIAPMIHYTGYVAEPPRPSTILGGKAGVGEVIVSAGGGAVGASLFRTALAARPRSCLAERPWRLITGPNLADEVFDELAWEPPSGVTVERWRNDMTTLLRNGVLSISQGGYNMVLDILQARTRAVVVPFATGGQTEQSYRCRLLAERGAFIVVEPLTLSADTLAKAIDRAINVQPKVVDVDMNGSTEAARFIASLGGDHRPRRGK